MHIQNGKIAEIGSEYQILDGAFPLSFQKKDVPKPKEAMWVDDICIVTFGWDDVKRNYISAFDRNQKLLWKHLARITTSNEIDPWSGPLYEPNEKQLYLVSYFTLIRRVLNLYTGELGPLEETGMR